MTSSSHDRLFHHHIALPSVHEKCEHEAGKEEYDIYDTKGKACFEHRTCLVDIQCQWRIRTPSYVSEWPEGKVE